MANENSAAMKELELLNIIRELYKGEGNMGEIMFKTIFRLTHISVLMPVQINDLDKLKNAALEASETGKLNFSAADLKPLVIENDKQENFLPCYTSEEHAGQREENVRYVKLSMPQLISLYEQMKDVSGIVLNPLTTNFPVNEVVIKHIMQIYNDELKRKANKNEEQK